MTVCAHPPAHMGSFTTLQYFLARSDDDQLTLSQPEVHDHQACAYTFHLAAEAAVSLGILNTDNC